MKECTSRERVLTAIGHQEPDRVPIIFGATLSTDILECPPDGKNYTKLCHYLGIKNYEKPKLSFAFNSVMNIDERVIQRFHSDFRGIDPNPPEVVVKADGTKTVLGVYCGLRVKKMGYFDDVFYFPLKQCMSKKELKHYPYWPSPNDFHKLSVGKIEEAKDLRENTNYVIVVDNLLAFPFLMYALLSGWDKFFLDMKLDPDFFFALADRLLEVGFGIVEHFIGPLGDYVDIVATYGDMGTQNGLLCSRKDYVTFIKPYEKKMIAHIKKYTSAKIYRHSCGSVYEVIPDFIENGVEILNPVQPLAKHMEPWRLKKEFGKDLTFCGGIDTQELLCNGTPDEIKEAVRHTIKTYAPGGAYILGPAHSFEPDVPPENIVAMYDAAYEYGGYPIS